MTPFGTGNENARIATSTSGAFKLDYVTDVCSDVPVTATFGGAGFTGTRTVQIQKFVDDEWVQVAQQAQAASGFQANLGTLPVGDHLFRWSVSGQGGPNNVEFTVTIVPCGCDDEFSGVTTCSEDGSERSATFTFIAGEDGTYKIQGGLTNFTGEDAIVIVDGDMVDSQWTPGNSSNRIISAIGTLEECDEVTITVSWNSSNGDTDAIIGDWSVELNGEKILLLDDLGCDDEGEGYAPVVVI